MQQLHLPYELPTKTLDSQSVISQPVSGRQCCWGKLGGRMRITIVRLLSQGIAEPVLMMFCADRDDQ